ncbi:hypothetical protein DFJ74DRAFT_644965 [Hyaloraphidium curvatum]|nr:hypothetical protein DFJ74DRAFT_644965 [Hyaloraphidium curvatum]
MHLSDLLAPDDAAGGAQEVPRRPPGDFAVPSAPPPRAALPLPAFPLPLGLPHFGTRSAAPPPIGPPLVPPRTPPRRAAPLGPPSSAVAQPSLSSENASRVGTSPYDFRWACLSDQDLSSSPQQHTYRHRPALPRPYDNMPLDLSAHPSFSKLVTATSALAYLGGGARENAPPSAPPASIMPSNEPDLSRPASAYVQWDRRNILSSTELAPESDALLETEGPQVIVTEAPASPVRHEAIAPSTEPVVPSESYYAFGTAPPSAAGVVPMQNPARALVITNTRTPAVAAEPPIPAYEEPLAGPPPPSPFDQLVMLASVSANRLESDGDSLGSDDSEYRLRRGRRNRQPASRARKETTTPPADDKTPENQSPATSLPKAVSEQYKDATLVHSATDSAGGVTLLDWDIWNSFHRVVNEVIVSRPGRCLFPVPAYGLTGLKEGSSYSFGLDLAFVDDQSYRFDGSTRKWAANGARDPGDSDAHFFLHPKSPQTGAAWMKDGVSFPQVRVTNDPLNAQLAANRPRGSPASASPAFLLRTFGKYHPRLHAIEHLPTGGERRTIHTFDVTEFIALSHYLNLELKHLKTAKNPNAHAARKLRQQDDEDSDGSAGSGAAPRRRRSGTRKQSRRKASGGSSRRQKRKRSRADEEETQVEDGDAGGSGEFDADRLGLDGPGFLADGNVECMEAFESISSHAGGEIGSGERTAVDAGGSAGNGGNVRKKAKHQREDGADGDANTTKEQA